MSPPPPAQPSVRRAPQCLLLGATAVLGWLLMQVLHEAGHVLHAWASGGEVERVVLHPLAFSRTLLKKNPAPLLVAWGGAIWGCVLPLLAVGAARLAAPKAKPFARALAGLCLLTNGVYLGAGAFFAAGDAGDLLAHGAARWHLVLFGVLACAGGLASWHGIGPAFGLDAARGEVDRRAVAITCALLATTVALEVALSRPE